MNPIPPPDTAARPRAVIPPRDPAADRRLVDLTPWYTHALDDDIHHKPGNTLAALPRGIQQIGGTLFDLRGVVQLAGARSREITSLIYPPAATGIPVGVAGRRLHFLHASAWDIEAPAPIGDYVMHFAGHEAQSVPVIYKVNIWDWWANPGVPCGRPAWTGQNERTRPLGIQIRLFKFTWEVPFPEDPIRSLDFASRLATPAPFLVAVTVE